MNISELAGKALAFRRRLDEVKRAMAPQPFEWYRYDSLANIAHLDALLTGAGRELPDGPILDIGSADGDLAFFLESLGCEVAAVDHPVTNHNHMAGIRKLKEALHSRITILPMDVDAQFTLPRNDFSLALILGALYHLKNPMFLLETVSRHAQQALISTRLARRIPGLQPSAKDVPMAYLLGADELNADESNFWIFTEAGFRRMLARTNWHIGDYMTIGDRKDSDPVSLEHDERVFCRAESRYGLSHVELLEGWHSPEDSGWRWTGQRFAARIRLAAGNANRKLRMKVYVPEGFAPLSLTSSTGGSATFETTGYHEFTDCVGGTAEGAATVRFALSKALPGDAADNRERGIIVYTLEIE